MYILHIWREKIESLPEHTFKKTLIKELTLLSFLLFVTNYLLF